MFSLRRLLVVLQCVYFAGANHLTAGRDDGTCCWGTPTCGGVSAENTGGWGHVGKDLRFRDPLHGELNVTVNKTLPRPYAADITGGYTYGMPYVKGLFIHKALGHTGQILPPGHDCPTCSPYYQEVILYDNHRRQLGSRRQLIRLPEHRQSVLAMLRRVTSNNSNSSNITIAPTAAPTFAAPPVANLTANITQWALDTSVYAYPPAPPVPLDPWYVLAPEWYLPVANYYVVPRAGNLVGKYHGRHIPICAQQHVIPPTRLLPVPSPAPQPPPPPPKVPTMTCWDGTVCPGRNETPGIQCCSVPVMAGETCAQIFICDKKRTCTGPRACFQAYESQWDVNNNGWELAGIMAFITVMLLFLCLFCLYCFCDRCIFNRRKYAAQRERKKYLKALPQLSGVGESGV